jgi:hypothetical protein
MRAAIKQFVERKAPVIPVILPGVKGNPQLPLFLREFSFVRFHQSANEAEALDSLQFGITGIYPGREDRWPTAQSMLDALRALKLPG